MIRRIGTVTFNSHESDNFNPEAGKLNVFSIGDTYKIIEGEDNQYRLEAWIRDVLNFFENVRGFALSRYNDGETLELFIVCEYNDKKGKYEFVKG